MFDPGSETVTPPILALRPQLIHVDTGLSPPVAVETPVCLCPAKDQTLQGSSLDIKGNDHALRRTDHHF
jgi:hypothetical protein